MIKLYRKHASGRIGTWRIWSEGAQVFYASAQVEGGKEVVHSEMVEVNQSGRTLRDQITLVIRSKVSKVLDKGYCEDRHEALKSIATNQLGFYRPMLAQRLDKIKNPNFEGAFLQIKLDGHRCLVTNSGGVLTAYSRQGKPITTIGHILKDLEGRIPEGVTIDGELYCHGELLQTIASWAKRQQADTLRLCYYAYDLVDNSNYKDRKSALARIVPENSVHVKLLKSHEFIDTNSLKSLFDRAKAAKYEGLIVRVDGFGYQDGKRSRGLIKVKSQLDNEYKVVDIVPSKDKWAVLICETPDELEFKCSAPGSVPEKTRILKNKDDFIGRWITIEYACLTASGIPFHGVAIRFRTDL